MRFGDDLSTYQVEIGRFSFGERYFPMISEFALTIELWRINESEMVQFSPMTTASPIIELEILQPAPMVEPEPIEVPPVSDESPAIVESVPVKKSPPT